MRWLKLLLSVALLYLAFRKVELGTILAELSRVPVWIVLAMLSYGLVTVALGSCRWAIVLFDRIELKKVLWLMRATMIGSFYGLFLPSSVGIDLVRWVPLVKAYPNLSKTKLVASVLIDRVVGFTAFVGVALASSVVGKYLGVSYPTYLLYVFGCLFLAVMMVYLLVYSGGLVERLGWFKKYRWTNKLFEVVVLLKALGVRRLSWGIFLGILSQFAWIFPIWWWSLIIRAGISLVSVMVIGPMVGLLLVLPISLAGFGARENLYLYFWGTMGILPEKILAVSTMNGIISVLGALVGGLLTFL
jgi:hypothetical protein